MIIAVNIISPGDRAAGLQGNFIFHNFIHIAKQQPQHIFVFISDRDTPGIPLEGNIVPVNVPAQKSHPWIRRYWYNYIIPRILKKYKASVFVSTAGCSLRTKIPQCLIIDDLAFHLYPAFLPTRLARFYKKNTPKFLEKANVIITLSAFFKNELITKYHLDENRADVIHYPVDDLFHPIEAGERNNIKEKYAGGNEYFLVPGDDYIQLSFINILKAFSLFKKRLRSNMQLVIITGNIENHFFSNQLNNYKYRNDVQQLVDLPFNEVARITAGAYATVYPLFFDASGVPILQSMKCGVPVVSSDLSGIHELTGEAALYANPHEYNDIANKMMMIFKDENLRNELINKSGEVVKKYSSETSAELLWASIVKTTA